MYEAEIVCCFPSACSKATFHSRVYGSFSLGSKAYRVSSPDAKLAVVIAGGAAVVASNGKLAPFVPVVAENGYPRPKALPTSWVARSKNTPNPPRNTDCQSWFCDIW